MSEDTPTLEDELLNWAKNNTVRRDKWLTELINDDIDDIQTLKKRAESSRWQSTLDKLSPGLRVKLRYWFMQNYPERVNTCTVDEFLNTIPPTIELNQYKKSKTDNITSVHVQPFSPSEIVEWTEFEAQAREFVWNVPQRVKKIALSAVSRSVVGELDVQACFQFWVFHPFNQVFQQIEEKMEFSRSSSDDICVGSPDFVFNINSDLSSFFEMKTLYTLDNHLTDLKIQWPHDNPSVKNSIEQVMGYLNFNGLKYGSLSSYQNTWFLKREGDRLFVSKAIAFDNLNPTLYRCIGYLVSLVRLSPTEVTVEPLLRRSSRIADQDPMNAVSGAHPVDLALSGNSLGISTSFPRNSGATDDLDLPDNFSITKLTELIGSGFCGKVFKWNYSGVTAAVKVCDAYNNREGVTALQNEANIYQKLKDIQGKRIPSLLFYGEAWGFYFLATTFIEGQHPAKLQDVQVNLDKVLDEVRERDVIHGDVKPSNVIIMPDNILFLIDFSHARIVSGTDRDFF
jgi:predicted Ser/Thr protein kinase